MKILKSRDIVLYPKATSAGTQYYDMETEDEKWLYDVIMRYQSDMNYVATFDTDFQKDYFKRRRDTLPKGKNGPNSIASILGWIINAKLENPNKNLSEPQIDALEAIFPAISQFYQGIEGKEVPAVRFVKKLFTLV